MVDNDSTKAQEFNYEGETFSSSIKKQKHFPPAHYNYF